MFLKVKVKCIFNTPMKIPRSGFQRGNAPWTETTPGASYARLVECCFTSIETVGLLGTGAQDAATSTFTQLLNSEFMQGEVRQLHLRRHAGRDTSRTCP